MSASLGRDDVAWARLSRSGLIEPFASPVEVARRTAGVQSQFVPPAGLAIRHRLAEPFTADDLDRHLHAEKDLLRLWGQRRTVHVYDTRDWATIVVFSQSLPNYRERLVHLLDKTEAELDAALDAIVALLEREGRLCRADVVEAAPELKPWFKFGTGMMMDLVRRGTVCHAGLEGGRSYFAHRDAWLPELAWDPPTPDEAGAELARRYFDVFGPATAKDFVFWTGAKARDARRWIEAVRDEVDAYDVDGEEVLAVGPVEAAPPRGSWPVLLVHRFDPILLAHKDKSWIVDDEHYKAVWRKAGYVEASVLRGGRISGTWAYEKKAKSVTVRVEPFGRIRRPERVAAERCAEGVAHYLGVPLGSVEIS